MRKVGFVVDSTFGYKGSEALVVPLKIIIDNKEYIDGTIENSLVVDALTNDLSITTSQPSPNAFVEAYEKQLEKYDHVICLTISKALSGTFNSANLAKDILENDKVTVIDTKSITMGANDIFIKTLDYANKGNDAEEVINYVNDLTTKGSIIFSVDNLSTLVKNGRLGRISGFIGNILKIKPILRFREGVLDVESKARGILGAFKYIVDQIKILAENRKIDVRIAYVDNIEYAHRLVAMVEDLNNENINITINGTVSPVVSAHIGLGGMGVYLTLI